MEPFLLVYKVERGAPLDSKIKVTEAIKSI